MLIFKKISWKNFLATGNHPIEIQLDRDHTTILLGQSGSGKSTMLDAISFALFNRPFRSINKTQLPNAINDKNCLVEIEFSLGSKEYLIRRGIKPNIFEIYCNKELLNQDSHNKDYQSYLEKQILKFNFKAFTQIVVLGASNFTPFMQLKPADRRTIIEGLLDIEIFSIMNNLLKSKITNIKNTIIDNEYQISLTKEKIAVHQKYLEDSIKDKEENVRENIKKIEENKAQIVELENQNNAHKVALAGLVESIKFKEEVLESISKVSTIEGKLTANTKKLEKEITFYQTHDNCPTCLQDIKEDFKITEIAKKEEKNKEFVSGLEQVKTTLTKLNSRLDEAKVVEVEINNIQRNILHNNSSIDAINQFIKKIAKDTIQIKESAQNVTDEEIDKLNKELESFDDKQKGLVVERAVHDMATSLLKDGGVKARIIKQYLPLINKFTNQFLAAMNFFVSFHMDEEFNESIKSRGRDNFSYSNFSEGEKQRIDLALLFTWRKIAKMKNSVNTNLLVLDEVLDSYLDTTATENVLQLVNSDMFRDTNVFVISHKESIADKFHANIRFTKRQNFSIIE